MKSSHLFSAFVLAASSSLLQAAPDISVNDLSPSALKSIATPRQKASMKAHEDAVAQAKKQRQDAIAKAKDITEVNDSGMKQTIQRRALNAMLPACERSPEAARNPKIYRVRGRR